MHTSQTTPVETFIACAGWSIPREASAAVGGEGSHLERYARVFQAVEINSAFYRPHKASTYERWADSVPASFRFSVKLPRSITHEGSLREFELPLRQFEGEAGALKNKLGAVLVQLPPKLAFDPAVAARFFNRLRAGFSCLLACEARHPSWFDGPATALLTGHGITRVIADPPAGQSGPHVPTSATIYARLHGTPRIYYTPYGPDYAAALGADMRTHRDAGRTVWCVFDNTASGAAMTDALATRAALLGI